MLTANVVDFEETRELEKEYDYNGKIINLKEKEGSLKSFLTLEFSNHSKIKIEIPHEFYTVNIVPLLTKSSPIQTSL